jgi:hypothetical protein
MYLYSLQINWEIKLKKNVDATAVGNYGMPTLTTVIFYEDHSFGCGLNERPQLPQRSHQPTSLALVRKGAKNSTKCRRLVQLKCVLRKDRGYRRNPGQR